MKKSRPANQGGFFVGEKQSGCQPGSQLKRGHAILRKNFFMPLALCFGVESWRYGYNRDMESERASRCPFAV
jgi:hypothetical protein